MNSNAHTRPKRVTQKDSLWKKIRADFKASPRWTIAAYLIALQLLIGLLYFIDDLLGLTRPLPAWPVWVAKACLLFILLMGLEYWISVTRRQSDKQKAASRERWRTEMRQAPLRFALKIVGAGIFFGAGVPAILYYVLLSPNFVPSTELRGFAHVSLGVVAVIGICITVLAMQAQAASAREEARGLRARLWRAIVIAFSPFLFAAIWMLFLNGLVSFLLHLASPKQTQWVTEAVHRSGGSAWRDFSCGGVWEAELADSGFWWPRRVCGIQRDDMYRLQQGGKIELHGAVSRFGVHFDSYRVR